MYDLLHPIFVTALLSLFGFIEVQGNYEAANSYSWSKEFSESRKTCLMLYLILDFLLLFPQPFPLVPS